MKILVIAPNWVGDLIIAQALLKLIKQTTPHAIIHVLVRNKLSSLLERMPEVDKILIAPTASGKLNFKQQYIFARALRAEKYDQALVLPNSFKSALIPFWAKIPKRTGWRGEMRYILLNDIKTGADQLPSLCERFLFLGGNAKTTIVPLLQTTAKNIAATLQKLQLKVPKNLLAICPGAEYGEAKRWPAEYFATIIKILAPTHEIWLFGGNNDQNITDKIQELSGNLSVNLAGKTSLAEAVDLLSCATAVVTNDSGLMHVAAALDKPLLAIYGSSSPKFTPPLTKKAQISSLNLPCSPCFQRQCPLKHLRCLKDITPQMVLNSVLNILQNIDTSTKET